MRRLFDTGCHVVAQAVKCADVDMVAAYPITPQTSVVEEIAALTESGEMNCRFLPVEGEHSAMAACVAAAAVGARAFTATSSQGLLYMHEVLHMASGCRFPLVMVNVNRAVFAPWTLWADHSDSLAQRDTGWLQLYCASLQEVFNTILQAYYIAERVRIPVMVNMDGFILSHCRMIVEMPDQQVIDKYLQHQPNGWIADPQNPSAYACVTGADLYPGFREELFNDTKNADKTIIEAAKVYHELTGMWDGDLIDTYRCDDADTFIIAIGSMAAEARISVDLLREQGIKAGLIKIRALRPFPAAAISDVLSDGARVMVLDRNYGFGTEGGIIFAELKAALFERAAQLQIANKIMGIGGADVNYQMMADAVTSAWDFRR